MKMEIKIFFSFVCAFFAFSLYFVCVNVFDNYDSAFAYIIK